MGCDPAQYAGEYQNQIILLVKDAQDRTLYTSTGWPTELENALQAAAPGSREQQVLANLLHTFSS